MNPYSHQSADAYLAQRVLSANPVQQAALLMEAGQRFLGRAIKAIETGQSAEMRRCLLRVLEIVNEATLRLNVEQGGELVENLFKTYSAWTSVLFEASERKDKEMLATISAQMGEIRQGWEQLNEKLAKEGQASPFAAGDQTV